MNRLTSHLLFSSTNNTNVNNNSLAISALFAPLLWSAFFSLMAYICAVISSQVRGSFLVDLSVNHRPYHNGDAYDVLVRWLRVQRIVSPPHSVIAEMNDMAGADGNEGHNEPLDPLLFLPSENASMSIVHRGRRIWITRHKHTNKQLDGRCEESLRLSCLGRTVEPLKELMHEAYRLARLEAAGRTPVWFCGNFGQWGQKVLRRSRPLTTISLSSTVLQVRDDVTEFLRSRQWYADRGLPWRRGYLLYGPPGNGKSSFAFALASELQLSLYVITLSSVSDKSLRELFDRVSGRALVLLEDVDSAVVSATDQRSAASSASDSTETVDSNSSKASGSSASLLTLSGLLNAIDGVGASEGRVLFLTTNHRHLLDPALIRPGRVDLQIEFRNASQTQIVDMFVRFYSTGASSSELLHDQACRFASRIPAEAISMAELQCHLLLYKTDPEACIAAAANLISSSASSSGSSRSQHHKSKLTVDQEDCNQTITSSAA